MVILSANLNNINLDNNFDEDDPDTIILIKLLGQYNKFKRHKSLNKNIIEELRPIAWHPRIPHPWNFCISENEKKEIELIFTD